MKNWNSMKIGGAAGVVAGLLMAVQAHGVIAYNFPVVNGNQNYPTGPLSLGEVFTVNSTISVDALAAYDNPANGNGVFGGPVQVAIYSVTLSGTTITAGSLAVSPMTFSSADPGTLIAGTSTREKALTTPVNLSAGTYMIVANNYAGGFAGTENNWNRGQTGAGTTFPTANTGGGLLTYGANYYFLGNVSGALPTGAAWHYDNVGNPANDWTPRYMAGNFDFTPVPEAAAFGAAGVGLLGLVYIGRYARLRRSMKLA
jgi:hypothetical protein